jgi:hypothetical protein
MTHTHITRAVRWLLIPTIILLAFTALAARNAYAQGGPEDRNTAILHPATRTTRQPPVPRATAHLQQSPPVAAPTTMGTR